MSYTSTRRINNAPQKNTRFKKSLLAMSVLALSAPSFAQTPAQDPEAPEYDGVVEEIVVSGMRQNLQNAQDIKRNADTFVDSITASDIGSLPDRSVLEALQRLPGVSLERFQAADDPDHFSVEGSGAVIRGMTATRSEFNGRDSFTADPGRGLSFQDVTPELMAGVDVYKNQSADMVEGGIGGTVSLRTRKPFDSDGRQIGFAVDGTWGDIAEEWKPSFSGLFSDRWDTSVGEFGFLISAAKSELVGVSHGIQSDVYKRYDAADLPGAERFVGDGSGTVWMPQGANLMMKEDNREREGLATSFQWQDNEGKYLVTGEYIRSEATLSWWENALKYQGGYKDSDRNTRPYGDTSFLFNDDGLFQSGFMAHGAGAWRRQDTIGLDNTEHNNRMPNPYNGMPDGEGVQGGLDQFGHKFQVDTRNQTTNTLVEDFSVNFKWTPDDAWTIELDVQHIEAETRVDDFALHLGVNALQTYDVTGSTPTLTLTNPWNGVRDDNPDLYANGVYRPGWTDDPQGDANYFQDPTSYWYRSGLDHFQRSDGESDAIRFDVKYEFEDAGLLKGVQAGYRFAERDQTVRATSWGWGSVAPEYSAGALYLDQVPDQSDYYELVDWSDFHGGGVLNIEGGNQLYSIKRDVINDLRLNPDCDGSRLQKSAGGEFEHYGCRDGVDDKFGLFLPSEITNTVEKNNAFYVRLDFGSDETKYRFSGNIGLRYIELDRTSRGYIRSAELDDDLKDIDIPAGLPTVLTGTQVLSYADPLIAAGDYIDYPDFYSNNAWATNPWNYLSESDRAYGATGAGWSTAKDSYDTILPSLNLKVELTDDLVSRFAVSKAVAYPDMSLVRNNINVSTNGYDVEQGVVPI